MELRTKSPYPGDKPHTVVTRACPIKKCRGGTPCIWHDQVIVALNIDGREIPEIRINKGSFKEMMSAYPDPEELFHLLADMAVSAHRTEPTAPVHSREGDFAEALAAVQQNGRSHDNARAQQLAQGGIW